MNNFNMFVECKAWLPLPSQTTAFENVGGDFSIPDIPDRSDPISIGAK